MATKDMRDAALRYARREMGHPKAEILDHVYDPVVENTMLVLLRTKGGRGRDFRFALVVKDWKVESECDATDFYRNAPHWKLIDRRWLNTKTDPRRITKSETCRTCGNTTMRKPLPTGAVYCPSCRDSWPDDLRSPHER